MKGGHPFVPRQGAWQFAKGGMPGRPLGKGGGPGPANRQPEERRKVLSEKELNAVKLQLPALEEGVANVAALVDKVVEESAPLVAKPPEEGEALTKQLEQIDTKAENAQTKLKEIRTTLFNKQAELRQSMNAGEALASLNKLTAKVVEVQRKLSPCKDFKKGFADRVAAQKSVSELAAQVDTVEPKIQEVAEMCKPAETAKLSGGELAAVDGVMDPAKQILTTVLAAINKKFAVADAAMKIELEALRKKCKDFLTKFEENARKLRASRQAEKAVQIGMQARETVGKAEGYLSECAEAEMPFLKGIEVLPKDESDRAFAASDKAYSAAKQAVDAARNLLKQGMMDTKAFPAELNLSDQLRPLSLRVDDIDSKLSAFRKDTNERKIFAVLAIAHDTVAAAETKIGALTEAVKIVDAEKIEQLTIPQIEECIKSLAEKETEAEASIAEARKVINSKRQEVGRGGGGDTGKSFLKLDNRVQSSQGKLKDARRIVNSAKAFVKAKHTLDENDAKLKVAETDVEKVASLVSTDTEAMTEVNVKAFDETYTRTAATLKQVVAAVQSAISTAPKDVKAKLQELVDRRTKALEKLEKSKADSRNPREKGLAQLYIKEVDANAAAVEAAIAKTSEVEGPFLKGIEVLPVKQSAETIAASEKAATESRETLNKARSYLTEKQSEMHRFKPDNAKPVKEAIVGVQDRLRAAENRLRTFTMDTATRKKAAMIHEAGVKVDELEALFVTVEAAAGPFHAEGAKDMTEAVAEAPIAAYLAAEKPFKESSAATRSFVIQRQHDARNNPAQESFLKKLHTRLAETAAKAVKAKEPITVHLDKYLSKKLIQEASEKVGTLAEIVATAANACGPLLKDGGVDGLVASSLKTLVMALTAIGQEKKLDAETLYKECSMGKKMNEKKFVAYVQSVGAAGAGHEEVNFSPERCAAIYKFVSKDGDFTKKEFLDMFTQTGIVKKEIGVTESISVDGGKILYTCSANEKVEVHGIPVTDETTKLTRAKCKTEKGEGWITLKQELTTFVSFMHNPLHAFSKPLDAAVDVAEKNVRDVGIALDTKIKEAAHLKAAKEEITKMKPKVASATAELKALKHKLAAEKEELRSKDQAEKRAHIDAKLIAEAKVIYGEAESQVTDVEAAVKLVESKAEPMANLSTDDMIEAFATPATLLAAVQKLADEVTKKVDAARQTIGDKQKIAWEIKPPTDVSRRAGTELAKLKSKTDKANTASRQILAQLAKKCDGIVKNRIDKVSTALRNECMQSGVTAESMFATLAKDGKISAKIFCKKISALEGLAIGVEHGTLICDAIESGGLSQRSFLNFVQKYFKVVKDIALTDKFEVNGCNTIRKANKDELFEVLRGPQIDEKIGVSRVEARSMLNGVTGWISVSGNQGTPFLEDVPKPFYQCSRKNSRLDVDVEIEKGAVRDLKESEVLELLQGPQKVLPPDASRAKIKATKGNTVGWITLRDRYNVTFAELNEKLYVCKTSVAMTDAESINDSKVLRKLAEGEMFEATGGVKEDAQAGVTRVEGKALKDNLAGWITVKGNAGTLFAELVPKYYSVVKETEILKTQQGSREVLRKIEPGETFKILEGPTTEKFPVEVRMKVRAASDKAVGWISKSNVKGWSPNYRVFVATSLSDVCAVGEATKTLRELAKGEQFEFLEGPVEEGKDMRIKGRAKKDGAVGWVTAKDEKGTLRVGSVGSSS